MKSLFLISFVFFSAYALDVKLNTQDVQNVYNKLVSPVIVKKLFKEKKPKDQVEQAYKEELSKSETLSTTISQDKQAKHKKLEDQLKMLKDLEYILTLPIEEVTQQNLRPVVAKSVLAQYSNISIPLDFVYILKFRDDEDEALDAMMNKLTDTILKKYGLSNTKYIQKLSDAHIISEEIEISMYGTIEKNHNNSFANKRLFTKDYVEMSGVSAVKFYPFKLHEKYYSQKSEAVSQTNNIVSIDFLNLGIENELKEFIQTLPSDAQEKILKKSGENLINYRLATELYAKAREKSGQDIQYYVTNATKLFENYPQSKNLKEIQQKIKAKMKEQEEINNIKTIIYLRELPNIKYEYAVDVILKEIVKELERASKIYAVSSNEKLTSSEYKHTQVNIQTRPLYENATLELYYDKDTLGVLVRFQVSFDEDVLYKNFVKGVNKDKLLKMKFIKINVKGNRKPLYIAEKEITQGMFFKFMRRNSIVEHCPMVKGKNYPVTCITTESIKKFIEKLNKKSAKFKYRLPKCHEWSYIATLDSKQKYCWGNTDEYMKYENIPQSKYDFEVMKVASLQANPVGLYDMCGNVRELCRYNNRTRSIGSTHYSLEPIITKYRLGPSTGFRLVKELR